MQYQKPGFIMNLASAEFGSDKPGVNYLLQLRAETNRWLLQHRHAKPGRDQLENAVQHVVNVSGLQLTMAELESILDLFPLARIELALHGIEKMDVQANVMDAISNFFLGCTWPRMSDNVKMDRFLPLLKHQASAMGYGVTHREHTAESVA